MKVALAEWRQSKSVQQWGMLGLQYIAAELRNNNIDTEIFLLEGMDLEKSCDLLSKNRPDAVGLSLFKENANVILKLCEMIKERFPSVTIFLGGHTATLYGARLLTEHPYVDVIVYGEGEKTALELCQRLDRAAGLEDCKGIFYRHQGMITRNEDRPLIADLDTLSFPIDDLLEKKNMRYIPYVFATVSTSRGCLGRCEFCVEHRVSSIHGIKEWRGRTPENIVAELLKLRKRFQDKRLVVRFVDGAFEDPDPINKVRLEELMDLISRHHLDISFSILTRAESWQEKDLPLIHKMRKLGLYSVSIGLESGAEDTLAVFGKRANVEDNRRACRLFREAEVMVYGFIIMFQPYSSLAELRSTAEFIREEGLAARTEYWLHAIYLYPDTRLYQRVACDGLIIGTDVNNYTYDYSFSYSDTQQVYEIAEVLQGKDSYQNYQMALDKIIQELELYRIWKKRYMELAEAEEIVRGFSTVVDEVSNRMGERQYAIFIRMLQCAEDGVLDRIGDQIIEEWEQLLKEQYRILNLEYIRFHMKLGRAGKRII